MSVLTHRMPCKNRHEKNVPKHKKCSGTFSFIVREILIYLAPSQRVSHCRMGIGVSRQVGVKKFLKTTPVLADGQKQRRKPRVFAFFILPGPQRDPGTGKRQGQPRQPPGINPARRYQWQRKQKSGQPVTANRLFLLWCARRDSNSWPTGS